MSNINQPVDIFAILGVQDLSNENAAALTGGASGGVKDVTLSVKDKNGKTITSFASDDAVRNLGNFDNKATFAAVNNNKTWRFYNLPNFDESGGFEDVGPDTARNLTKMKGKVSSFKAL
jgi:hypothetical protein